MTPRFFRGLRLALTCGTLAWILLIIGGCALASLLMGCAPRTAAQRKAEADAYFAATAGRPSWYFVDAPLSAYSPTWAEMPLPAAETWTVETWTADGIDGWADLTPEQQALALAYLRAHGAAP